MANTLSQYQSACEKSRDIFMKKMQDYGTAWRILRSSSLTDQLFIKANRIRTIQDSDTQMVDEGEEPEFVGIVNYSVMALIQMDLGVKEELELSKERAESLYDQKIQVAQELMIAKNHDYGEAWRDMRVSSLTDLILMKILRVKQIEDNQGKTVISEGIDANYLDMINYALFALILLEEQKK